MAMTDEEYMLRAVELAKKGTGWTNPNPLVGAVIVKGGRIIGEGYHKKYGGLHAEREALASANEDVSGATIYVTILYALQSFRPGTVHTLISHMAFFLLCN